MKEDFRKLKNYPNYEVSNLGRVRSNCRKHPIFLKGLPDKNGYLRVVLYTDNNKRKYIKIHQLVGIAFLNHNLSDSNLVINHKDFNVVNNTLDNLEIVTLRENSSKTKVKGSSKYTGVTYNKSNSKYRARILIEGRSVHLGYFESEYIAHIAYEYYLRGYNKRLK